MILPPPANLLQGGSQEYKLALLVFLLLFTKVIEDTRGADRLTLTSWYRDANTNARVGGVPTSLHKIGLAIDFVGPLESVQRVVDAWRELGLDAVVEANGSGHVELDGPQFRIRAPGAQAEPGLLV